MVKSDNRELSGESGPRTVQGQNTRCSARLARENEVRKATAMKISSHLYMRIMKLHRPASLLENDQCRSDEKLNS